MKFYKGKKVRLREDYMDMKPYDYPDHAFPYLNTIMRGHAGETFTVGSIDYNRKVCGLADFIHPSFKWSFAWFEEAISKDEQPISW